ncbi:response regulator [uncultured Roseobacter sp.]|uniref:response regulator n=1 Tax=uncultured Roseobacter sp. TaxID=114847 RepID=UPI00261FDBBB|nr:response regulator [uncultured Roseobacter sp.]
MTTTLASLGTVLLVDDDKVTNLMHQRILDRSGLVDSIDVATDGLAALEYLEARVNDNKPMPELILLDINMPRLNGFEFLERYAKLPVPFRSSSTLIIMLSTSVLREDMERAHRDPHVYRFITKPIDKSDVQTIIHEYHELVGS